MKKAIASAALCTALSAMLAVPAMAEDGAVNTSTTHMRTYNNATPNMYLSSYANGATNTYNTGTYGTGTTTYGTDGTMGTYSTTGRATTGTAYAPGVAPYSTTRASSIRANAVTPTTANKRVDWGWLGLLGLIGLAGLRGRGDDRDRDRGRT